MGKKDLSEKDSANIKKKIEQENESLMVNGLFLPEKKEKENTIQRSIYMPPQLYADFYKIASKLKISMNEIHILLASQFTENNKHLLK